MSRSRNIKPAIMDNEDLADLEPLTRLLFIYLWMLADREGRLEDRPKRIAAQALPYDRTADVDAMLNDLKNAGFIDRYEVDGVACIQVINFAKHQTPHVREQGSSLPNNTQGTTKVVPCHDQGCASSSPRSPDSLIPDSLIPDSLIPDSLIPDSGDVDTPRKRGARAHPPPKPDDVDLRVWADWLELRKAKRAPVTQTVLDDAQREAAKAGMTLEAFLREWCSRGSQGLKAEWLSGKSPPQAGGFVNKQEALEARNRAVAAEWVKEMEAKYAAG